MEVLPFHFFGDLHYGISDTSIQYSPIRLSRFLSDAPNWPRVAAHLHPGDLTQDSLPEEDSGAQTILNDFPSPWISAIGNHDTYDRSGDAAAAAMGLPGKNQSHDFGFSEVIVLGPDEHVDSHTVLTQPTLDYLDARLSACAPRPAIVMAHAALFNTVVQTPGGPPELVSDEDLSSGYVKAPSIESESNGVRDQPVRDVLSAHSNARMWLSGHTHNPIHNPTLWTSVELGGKHVICGNGSALTWTQPPADTSTIWGWFQRYQSRLVSMFLYLLSDRIEIRYRDHLNRKATTGPNDEPLSIIYYDDGLLVHERRA